MSDLKNVVQVQISADASQANKAFNDIRRKGESLATPLAQSGKKSADSFWGNWNRAQDRWLKVAESGFRRFGGTIGLALAGAIGGFDKFSKAVESTKKSVGAGSGGKGIGIGEAILASFVGSSKSGKDWISNVLNTPYLMRKKRQLHDDSLLNRWTRREVSKNIASGMPDEQNIEETFSKWSRANTRVRLGRGLNTAARAGIGAAGGLIGAAFAANEWIKFIDAQKESNSEAIKTVVAYKQLKQILDKLPDSTSKFAELTKRFGADATDKFEEMGKAAKRANWELENTKAWQVYLERAENMTRKYGVRITAAVKEVAGRILTLNPFGFAEGSIENQIADAKAQTTELRRRADEIKPKKDKEAKDQMGLLPKLADMRFDKLSDVEQLKGFDNSKIIADLAMKATKSGNVEDYINLENAKKERAGLRESVQKTGVAAVDEILEKNPGMYDPTKMSTEEILKAESERLINSTLSPSEQALRRVAQPVDPKKNPINQLLERSKTIGKQGSFKHQLTSPAKYEQNKKALEQAVKLEDLLKAFVQNGNAWPVKPHNGK